jgi:hypothetical protein
MLSKHVIEGKIEGRIKWREDEEEDLRIYWVTLREKKGTGNCKRKN